MDINTSKLKLSYILIFCLFVLCEANAQVVNKQIIDRTSGRLPKEQLDKGVYRCIYHFTQQVIERETGATHFVTDTMALDFGRNVSQYYDWNKAQRDSVQNNWAMQVELTIIHHKTSQDFDMVEYKDEQGAYFVNAFKGENAEIYKNRLTDEIITIDVTNMEALKCVEPFSPFQWQFSPDTLTVLGYVCQKASASFRGRNYEVWFSPGIPIQEGPWKLQGLPGLILKAVVDDGLFVFEAIGLENLDNVDITMNMDSYLNCTRQQFAKYKSDKRKRLTARHYVNGYLTVGTTPNPYDFYDLEIE